MTGRAVTVRPARPDDAPGLGDVHVAAWRAAYRGVMPSEFLDGLQAGTVADRWARALTTRPMPVLVAEDGGGVVGFATYGPQEPEEESRDGARPDETAAEDGSQGSAPLGRLYAINLHPDAFGTGAGTALLTRAEEGLADLGFASAVLWVVPGNARARRFYERQGWVHDGLDRVEHLQGVTVDVTRYSRRLRPGGGTPPTSPSPAG